MREDALPVVPASSSGASERPRSTGLVVPFSSSSTDASSALILLLAVSSSASRSLREVSSDNRDSLTVSYS